MESSLRGDLMWLWRGKAIGYETALGVLNRHSAPESVHWWKCDKCQADGTDCDECGGTGRADCAQIELRRRLNEVSSDV